VTPKQLARLGVGALLLAETSARKAIAKAVETHVDNAAAELQRRKDNERKAAALVLLLGGARAMSEDVRAAIVAGRKEAREAARRRLNAELKTAGIVIEAHEWVVGNRMPEDTAHAASAAESLAGQWRGLAIAVTLAAKRKETSAASEVSTTIRPMRARIERTATSEIAQAYNDEHVAALRDIVEHDRAYRDGELADRIETQLARQWSALVDACERCWPLDGVTVGINESFPGGDEPGSMHIRCRCIDVLVEASESSRLAA